MATDATEGVGTGLQPVQNTDRLKTGPHILRVTPGCHLHHMLPAVADWFRTRFGSATPTQRLAWPTVLAGQSLLLAAPTGSGKTLAGFLPILDQLLRQPHDGGLRCLYVAPLKALVRDARKNLRRHLRELGRFLPQGHRQPRLGLRIGETSRRVRQRQIEDPPDILLTTPESLAVLLSNHSAMGLFTELRWIVIDEVHALAACKRGTDLALSLERIELLAAQAPVRIGLSATCAPLATAAQFLVGTGRPCTIAQVPDRAGLDIAIEPLSDEAGFLARLLERIAPTLERQRTTLIFTNTRSLAERLTWALRQRYPNWCEQIGVHHSALAPARRRSVERRLKQGRLRVAVSSTSLELGIDIGSVDSVILVHPPGGVARLLQRIGRAGHRPNQPRLGLVLTTSSAELLEATVTASSGRLGQIEALRLPTMPLDVVCQHLVGMAITGAWTIDEARALVRRAYPLRDLGAADFQACLDYLLGLDAHGHPWLPARLVLHGDRFTIVNERIARLLRRNLGTILTEEPRTIQLLQPGPATEFGPSTTFLGEVDDVFADQMQPGDRFLLEGRCLEYRRQHGRALLVEEVMGRPQVPRWLGTGWPLSPDLARRLYHFRLEAAEALRDGAGALADLLRSDYGLAEPAALDLVALFQEQERVSEIPDTQTLLIETVPACSYYLHTPLARNGNDALARVLTVRLRRDHQAACTTLAADLGILLAVQSGPTLTPHDWRSLLSANGFAVDLEQSLAECPSLRERFARVATTGLMVLRNPVGGRRRVGGRDWVERRLFDQVRGAAPDFVLLRQAERELREDTCDGPAALEYLQRLPRLHLRCRALVEPSPLALSWTQTTFTAVASMTGAEF